ncbi:MAG: hypothetical protein N3B13_02250 [Deltaproteobacteria bacterium]|nr:hypothetical protein [Deltaproteobacteria bacterium]
MINRKDIIPLFFILIVTLVIFAVFLNKRPFTDEGSFCTIAQAVSNGSVLYRDIYNEKAPLPYMIASLFINLGSNPIMVLRSIAFVFFLTTVFLIYLLGRMNMLNTSENTVLTTFFILTAPLYQSFNYTAEIIATPLILFVVWQIGKESEGKINFLTGFFSGLLIFIKQPFVLFALVAMVFAVRSGNIRKFFIPGFISALIFVFLLLKISGVYEPYIDNVIFTVKRYDIVSYMRLPYPNEYYQFAVILSLFIIIISGFVRKAVPLFDFLSLLSLMVVGIVRMDAFKLLPFFTVLVNVLSRKGVMSTLKNNSLILILLSCVSVCLYKDIIVQRFDGIKAISYTIEAKTDSKDSIWVGPHEANIYCLSRRRPSSKYFFLLPWINRPEVLMTLSEDLIKRDPPACLVDVSEFNKATDYPLSKMIPEFSEIIRDFRDIQEINGAVIYCRR